MPKLELTPWKPDAVFRPFMLLVMRKIDADNVTEVSHPGFNRPLQSTAVLPLWKDGAEEAHALISRLINGMGYK